MTCLHLGLAAAMLAASLASAPAGADDAAEWVSKQAIRLRSFEPSDRDFSDLAPLKAAIGEARVVMLGEQTHGDGATFLGKTRLIEFLHEEMGFDVLCFESGLYDCDRAWRALRSGTDAWSAMQLGIFPIWMESRQLAPLTEFMDRAAKSGRPMELCGYDCQLTGPASREHLGPDLRQLATSVGPPALDEAELGAIDGYLQSFRNGKGPEGPVKADGEAAFAKLAAALDEPRFATSLAERDRAFWKQMLRSLPAFGTMMGQLGKPGMSLAAQFNPRDEQGGETLVWLARQRYPDRKIVVWAASMHCIRDPETIDTGSPNFSYQGVHPMGHVASLTLGKEVYVIAFTTGPGEAGSVFRPAGPVPEPPPGSIEAVCGSVGTGPCIVPLRGAGDDTFGGGVFVARPLGNAPMRSRWRENVDAFAYTPTMVPSTRRATVEEAEAYGDLGTALEKATANAKARCAEQHTYADTASAGGPTPSSPTSRRSRRTRRRRSLSSTRRWPRTRRESTAIRSGRAGTTISPTTGRSCSGRRRATRRQWRGSPAVWPAIPRCGLSSPGSGSSGWRPTGRSARRSARP